uniref:Gag-pol polyprotein n=1 Tax=Solanum tuberosum TaxID=4113 RepID=M1DQR2_SOLTU
MLHDDMNISRLMVYAQSIEESKLKRMNRDLKRGRSDEQGQPRFKKRTPNQDSSSASKANEEKSGGSQFSKPLCATCGKRHHGKCLASTSGCYGCGKSDHQVRNCPTLAARGREAKQASYVGPDPNAPKKNRFYALEANKDNGANPDEGTVVLTMVRRNGREGHLVAWQARQLGQATPQVPRTNSQPVVFTTARIRGREGYLAWWRLGH